MENISKAFIMAATVLLGLMMLTIFIRVFRAGASVNENYDETQRTAQLILYNAKFEDFNVPDNTIMDIITVANHAYSVNQDAAYDPTSAIKINIKIGGKEYTIPDIDPNPPAHTSSYSTMKSNGTLFEKNKIMHAGKAMPIYDLLNKTAYELGISELAAQTEKLTRTYYGPVSYVKKYTAYVKDPDTDVITETDVAENVTEVLTVYKYLFNCTNIEYHSASGKIKSMTFERNIISDTTSPNYWNSSVYDK